MPQAELRNYTVAQSATWAQLPIKVRLSTGLRGEPHWTLRYHRPGHGEVLVVTLDPAYFRARYLEARTLCSRS